MEWGGVLASAGVLVAGEVVTQVFRRWLKQHKRGDDFVPFFVTLFRFGYLFVAAALILQSFGFDVGSIFLGTGGVVAFIIGFAFKDFLTNVSAGLWLLIVDPFDVGDEIEVAGVRGELIEITALSLIVKDGDGNMVYVSNKLVWSKPVKVKRF